MFRIARIVYDHPEHGRTVEWFESARSADHQREMLARILNRPVRSEHMTVPDTARGLVQWLNTHFDGSREE